MEHIEEKLAYQEDAIQRLSDRIIEQQAEIDQLSARCERLRLMLEEFMHKGAEGAARDEIPPHY